MPKPKSNNPPTEQEMQAYVQAASEVREALELRIENEQRKKHDDQRPALLERWKWKLGDNTVFNFTVTGWMKANTEEAKEWALDGKDTSRLTNRQIAEQEKSEPNTMQAPPDASPAPDYANKVRSGKNNTRQTHR
jgi:hypothetical protein